MMKLFKALMNAAIWALAAIGLLVAVATWWLVGGDDKPKEKEREMVREVMPAEAEKPLAIFVDPGRDCACGLGAQCTGPRGGKFCVDESGNKRYK